MDGNEISDLAAWERNAARSLAAVCSERADRVKRFLGGDIAADRDGFQADISALHQVSRNLLIHGQDMERRLGECGAKYRYEFDRGGEERDYCGLPGGHRGRHRAPRQERPAEYTTNEVRNLADLASRISERLGWLAPIVDRCTDSGLQIRSPARRRLQQLAEQLLTLGDQAEQLAESVLDLDLGGRDAALHNAALDDAADIMRQRLDQVASGTSIDPNQLGLL